MNQAQPSLDISSRYRMILKAEVETDGVRIEDEYGLVHVPASRIPVLIEWLQGAMGEGNQRDGGVG